MKRLEVNLREDVFELGFGICNSTVVMDVVVGSGDRAAFFDIFDFVIIAFFGSLAVKGADRAFGEAFVAERAGADCGDNGDFAGKSFFEGFVFGPRIETIKDNALLAGGDEVFDFSDSLASDPVVAFFFTNLFAEDFFVLRG